MKIYLDMCCYNRPYDPQEQIKINLETQAKLYIQEMIKQGGVQLVSSYILDYEVSNVPAEDRKQTIKAFIDRYSSEYVGGENHTVVEAKASEIMKTGVKEKDALHVASAILSGCGCFISTDRRLLKYKTEEIRMMNPTDFVIENEEERK